MMISMLMLSITLLVEAKPDENTVAIWLFEEGDGEVVEDASQNGHAGEIIGTLEWVETEFGTGLKFPGDGSGYILIDSTKHLELHKLSIEAFVKVEASTGKWQGIVCKQRAGCADRNYGIWVNPNTNALHAEIGANGQCGFNVGGQTVLTDNEWHHLAFTFDGETGRVYVDGELEAEKANAVSFQSDTPLTIGTPQPENPNGLLGIIEAVRISNVARTQEEIRETIDLGLDQIADVAPGGKLTTRWGYIKHIQ
ncbi:MAG: LamG domain-containing protein [Candidatus Poribacteria bacterium]|nr:LamG domain-containing protein [Candidatus Poribacteria bacterium]